MKGRKRVNNVNEEIFDTSNFKDAALEELLNEDIINLLKSHTHYCELITLKQETLRMIQISDQNKNIFGMSRSSLQDNISKLAKHVLIDLEKTNFINGEGAEKRILIPANVLDSVKEMGDELFGNEYKNTLMHRYQLTPFNVKYRLITYLLALRLGKEVSSSQLPFPKSEISDAEAKSDFENLKTYVQEKILQEEKSKNRKNKEIFIQTDQRSGLPLLSFNTRVGNKAVDSFTYTLRAKARLNHSGREYRSPYEVFTNPNPCFLIQEARSQILAYYRKKLGMPSMFAGDISEGVSSSSILLQLRVNLMVSNFPPSTLSQLIHVLTTKYGLSIPKNQDNSPTGRMLDPCGGWGGRLVGTFADSLFSHYTVIEPNTELTQTYTLMHKAYAPTKTITIFNKKVEDVSIQDVCPNESSRYHMVFTSPPYMGVETYPNSTGNEYWDGAKWEKFKYSLMEKSMALVDGGMIVINVASIKGPKDEIYDLPGEFKSFVEKYASQFQLKYVHTLFGAIVGRGSKLGSGNQPRETCVIARREAVLPLTKQLQYKDEQDFPEIIEISDDEKTNFKPK